MVTLQILVLSFQVRILVAQQKAKRSNRAELQCSALFLFCRRAKILAKRAHIKSILLNLYKIKLLDL